MQTFLPYRSFQKSARCLDSKRLGKQRVEAKQILNTLQHVSTGWRHHPAVKMWKGYEDALEQYLREMIVEWVRRGNANSIPIPRKSTYQAPPWLGWKRFHQSHKSNLLRKHPAYYGDKFKVESNLPYYWPKEQHDNNRDH